MFNAGDLEKAISEVTKAASSSDLSYRFIQAWDLLNSLRLRGTISQPQAAEFCEALELKREERGLQLWLLRNAFEFNPLWPTRTDPVFVVRTLEQSAGTNLDTNQRFAICAVLDGLPVGASMRDFVVAMKARDTVALGITPEQYTALEPIFETIQTWQKSNA